MKKKLVSLAMCTTMIVATITGCGNSKESVGAETETSKETVVASTEGTTTQEVNDFEGSELSILVSAGWMDNRYDSTIARFEDTYSVTVDLQTIPADQYGDILQSKLTGGTCADIFWIQSNPFAIESVIVDYENYCIDFTGAEWKKVIPEPRLSSCMVNDKLYGLQLWHNSPEYVMLYNKTMFDELGIAKAPSNYAEFLNACETISKNGITPWFVPGADGWQHQLVFHQIGGEYEEATPGLYEGLNNNTAKFEGNAKMLEVLKQYKELSDKGYLGEDWIGSDSTNLVNEFADRNIAMAMANSSLIQQIKDETGSSDEYGLFLIPLGDNDTFPTNPAGPTMFGYKGTQQQALVEEFFNFVCTTESLQEILDHSPAYTNIHANDKAVIQRWLPEEEAFMSSIPEEKMMTSVLQTGTKYTNDYWMDFGADLVAYCQGTIQAEDILKNMDNNRATAAQVQGDENWK